jgi:hypothetical protein
LFLITLRAARVNLKLPRTAASEKFHIHSETLKRYEDDSTHVPKSFFDQIESVYGIPTEYIYFGKESDYIKNLTESLFKEVNTMT